MEINIINAAHNSSVLKYLATSFKKEDNLDVAFVCKGGKIIRAHQLVLASVSPFLRTMFNESRGTAGEVCISLSEIDDRLATQLIILMYEGAMKLPPSDLQEFQELVDMLGIKFPGNIDVGCANASGSMTSDTAIDGTLGNNPERPIELDDPNDDPLNIPDQYFVPSKTSGSGQLPKPTASSQSRRPPSGNTMDSWLPGPSTSVPAIRRSTESTAAQTGSTVKRISAPTEVSNLQDTGNGLALGMAIDPLSVRVKTEPGVHKTRPGVRKIRPGGLIARPGGQKLAPGGQKLVPGGQKLAPGVKKRKHPTAEDGAKRPAKKTKGFKLKGSTNIV